MQTYGTSSSNGGGDADTRQDKPPARVGARVHGRHLRRRAAGRGELPACSRQQLASSFPPLSTGFASCALLMGCVRAAGAGEDVRGVHGPRQRPAEPQSGRAHRSPARPRARGVFLLTSFTSFFLIRRSLQFQSVTTRHRVCFGTWAAIASHSHRISSYMPCAPHLLTACPSLHCARLSPVARFVR